MGSTIEEHIDRGQHPVDEMAVRADFEAALLADGTSLKTVATESGIGESTLASWRKGTYVGRGDNIAGRVRKWLVAREARLRARATVRAAPSFIMTKTASELLEAFEQAQTRVVLAKITGGPGIGKTTTARKYRAAGTNVWIATMEPCTTTVKAMLDVIAAELGLFMAYRTPQLSMEIRRRLQGTAGLLIIDEVQHLPPEALDQLRMFHDLAEIGVAMVGNEMVETNLTVARRVRQMAQFNSRVGVTFRRQKSVVGDIRPMLDAWELRDDDVRREATLIAQQPGGLRNLTMTLRIAYDLALAAEMDTPTLDQVRLAWGQLSGQNGGAP